MNEQGVQAVPPNNRRVVRKGQLDRLSPLEDARYRAPGDSRWLLDTFRFRHLLSMLLKKGTTTRYYGSVMGWGWSYLRPAIQFFMYFFLIGVVLLLHHHSEFLLRGNPSCHRVNHCQLRTHQEDLFAA